MEVDWLPLLDDAYLRTLYSGKSPKGLPIIASYLRRLRALAGGRRPDLLWVEKELFPWLPARAEALASLFGTPYAVDYDDATCYSYSRHRLPVVRRLLGNKIRDVMRGAALVVAGNQYLAEKAREAGAPKVAIIPTVVDLASYPPAPTPSRARAFTIGWIGSPFTAKYLSMIQPALAEVCATGDARLVLVGSGPVEIAGVPTEVRPWSEATEADDARSFDVGVMPLPDEPWERGKCGYKLIQYMACGKPVIASPVGVNKEIVETGVNGFLAETLPDWVKFFNLLRSDPDLGARLGGCGREKVETRYCTRVSAPVLCEALLEAAGRRAAPRGPAGGR